MSAPQAAAITACTACAAVGGAAAGGAFSSSETTLDSEQLNNEDNTEAPTTQEKSTTPLIVSKPLSEETASDSATYTAETVGKKYEHYLVAVYGENNSNQDWWTDVYNKKYKVDLGDQAKKGKLTDELKEEKVTLPFAIKNEASADKNKALNKGCEAIFKKKHADVLGASANNKDKYKNDLWVYCSLIGETPKTVQDASEDTSYDNENKIGKTKKADLLATKDGFNTKLWDLKNTQFKQHSTISDSKYFNALLAKTKETNPSKTLKDGCKEAYSMTSNSGEDADSKVTETMVVKYCSLDGAA